VAGAPERTPHIGAIEVFAEIHQRQKSAEDSSLQVVRQVQPASRYARQPLAMLGDEAHDLALAFLGGIAKGRFAPHFAAARLYGQSEMENAEPLFGESRGRVVLASRDLTRRSHGTQGAAR